MRGIKNVISLSTGIYFENALFWYGGIKSSNCSPLSPTLNGTVQNGGDPDTRRGQTFIVILMRVDQKKIWT